MCPGSRSADIIELKTTRGKQATRFDIPINVDDLTMYIGDVVTCRTAEWQANLMPRIVKMYGAEDTPPSAKTVARDLLASLLKTADRYTKRQAAISLATAPGLERGIAKLIANDHIDVARPLLEAATPLSEGDLLDVIVLQPTEYHEAICRRPDLSMRVVNALIKTGSERTALALLANSQAKLGALQFRNILDRFGERPEIVGAVTRRPELPVVTSERVAVNLTGATLQNFVARHSLDLSRLSQLVHLNKEHVLLSGFVDDMSFAETRDLVARLAANDLLSQTIIMRALCLGHFSFVLLALAETTGSPAMLIRKLLLDKSEEGASRLFYQSNFHFGYRDLFLRIVGIARAYGFRSINEPRHDWMGVVGRMLEDAIGSSNPARTFEQCISDALILLSAPSAGNKANSAAQ